MIGFSQILINIYQSLTTYACMCILGFVQCMRANGSHIVVPGPTPYSTTVPTVASAFSPSAALSGMANRTGM